MQWLKLPAWNICIRHRWEGEMGLSQHKSPHQARAFRRGLYVVASAEISHLAVLAMQYAFSRTNIWRCKPPNFCDSVLSESFSD